MLVTQLINFLIPRIYFGLVVFSGLFAVTFSVIFAYVADVTDEHERTFAYGAVIIVDFTFDTFFKIWISYFLRCPPLLPSVS